MIFKTAVSWIVNNYVFSSFFSWVTKGEYMFSLCFVFHYTWMLDGVGGNEGLGVGMRSGWGSYNNSLQPLEVFAGRKPQFSLFTCSYETFQPFFCLRPPQPFENTLWQFPPQKIPSINVNKEHSSVGLCSTLQRNPLRSQWAYSLGQVQLQW